MSTTLNLRLILDPYQNEGVDLGFIRDSWVPSLGGRIWHGDQPVAEIERTEVKPFGFGESNAFVEVCFAVKPLHADEADFRRWLMEGQGCSLPGLNGRVLLERPIADVVGVEVLRDW